MEKDEHGKEQHPPVARRTTRHHFSRRKARWTYIMSLLAICKDDFHCCNMLSSTSSTSSKFVAATGPQGSRVVDRNNLKRVQTVFS